MAVTRVAAGSVSKVTSGNMAPGEPAGAQADDILLCFTSQHDNIASSMSGDWTQLYAVDNGTTLHAAAWWCRRGSSPPSYTVTHGLGGSSLAVVIAYRGCLKTATPIDASGTQSSSGSSSTITAPAETMANDYDTIVFPAHIAVAGGSFSTPYGSTNPAPSKFFDDSSNLLGSGLAICDGTKTDAGDTGARTGTYSSAGLNVGGTIGLIQQPMVEIGNETGGVTEDPVRLLCLIHSKTEKVWTVLPSMEGKIKALTLTRLGNETAGGAEQIGRRESLVRLKAEYTRPFPFVNEGTIHLKNINCFGNESAAGTEGPNHRLAMSRIKTENAWPHLPVADMENKLRTLTMTRLKNETAAGSEAVSRLKALLRYKNEGTGLDDIGIRSLTMARLIGETAAGSESRISAKVLRRLKNETAGTTESIPRRMHIRHISNEMVDVTTDSLSVLGVIIALIKILSETVVVTTQSMLVHPLYRVISELMSITADGQWFKDVKRVFLTLGTQLARLVWVSNRGQLTEPTSREALLEPPRIVLSNNQVRAIFVHDTKTRVWLEHHI